MCTQNQALTLLGEVYNHCNPILGNAILDAYLYGSYARGDYNESSDIDILLSVDMDASTISKHRQAIATVTSNLSLKYDITVSVTVKAAEHFRKYGDILPFYKNVISEGIRYAI